MAAASRCARTVLAGFLVVLLVAALALGAPASRAAGSAAQTGSAPSFADAVHYATPIIASAVAVADFTSDGKPDVVTASTDSVSVLLYPGVGDGYLGTPLQSVAAYDITLMTPGDFDRDGRLDLAVVNTAGPIYYVLLGNGDGTFRISFVDDRGARYPASIAALDWDEDGRLDVVVPAYAFGTLPHDVMMVMRGRGDGTFAEPELIAWPTSAGPLASADLDHDGHVDLVVGNNVFLGQGGGQFQHSAAMPFAVESVVLGDMNGDGRLDITASSLRTVAVLLGRGDGAFGLPEVYSIPGDDRLTSLAVADLNGDQHLDVAVTSWDVAAISVLIGVGDGTLRPAVALPIAAPSRPMGPGGPSLAAADLSGDGLPELVALTLSWSPYSSTVDVLRNTCGLGTALRLDGQAGFASTPHAADLNPSGDWTVETWFKDASPLGFDHEYSMLLNKGDRQVNGESPYFVMLGYKRLVVGVRTGWTDYSVGYGVRGVDPLRWHHVAGVYRAATRNLQVFLDGKPVAQGSLAASSPGNTLALQIGRNGPSSGKYFDGDIDDVRVWHVARSAAEIASSYRSAFVSAPPGLIANWRFDERTGASAVDLTGRHTALLSGGARFVTDVHP